MVLAIVFVDYRGRHAWSRQLACCVECKISGLPVCDSISRSNTVFYFPDNLSCVVAWASCAQIRIVASPMYAAIELFRMPLTGIVPDPALIAISLSSGIILLVTGLIYFRRTEDFIADLA